MSITEKSTVDLPGVPYAPVEAIDRMAMIKIASKYVGVRWSDKINKFEIQKQINGLRERRYTSNPDDIEHLIEVLVNELKVKSKDIPIDGVPNVVLTKYQQPELTSKGKEVWTIKKAESHALKEYEKEGAHKSTSLRLKHCCNHLANILSGKNTLITEIDFDIINVIWEEELIEMRNSKSTINKKKSSIQKMMRNAVESGHLDHMPIFKRRKVPIPPPRYLKRDEANGIDEEKQILEALQYVGKFEHIEVVICLLDLGCRQSELFLIQEQDVNVSENSIYIRTTKNGNPRTVFMSKRVRPIIQKRLTGEMSNRVLFDYDNDWVRNGWDRMRQLIPYTKYFDEEELARKWCKVYGVEYTGGKAVATTRMADKGFTAHICRHTCLTRLVDQGVPLEKVQEWAGHRSILITRRYVTVRSAQLKSMAGLLDAYVEAGGTKDEKIPFVIPRSTNKYDESNSSGQQADNFIKFMKFKADKNRTEGVSSPNPTVTNGGHGGEK